MVDRLVNSEANAKRIRHVEECFGSSGQPLAVPGRVLVGEGILIKMCRKKPKSRQFFLFNDILVYGNVVLAKRKYNKQHLIPLDAVQLEDLKDETDLRNGWLVKTPTKSFAVYAATSTEKREWMVHIQRCVDDLLAKSGKLPPKQDSSAPVWVPDSEAQTCMQCKRVQFSILNRRHHCRKCGMVVCNNCSNNRFMLPNQYHKPLRVCGTCYRMLSSTAPSSTARMPASVNHDTSGDDDSDEDDDKDGPTSFNPSAEVTTFYSDPVGTKNAHGTGDNYSMSSEDLAAALVILTLSSVALIAYILVILGIYRIWKESKNAFHLLLIALGISDSIMLALFVFYATPATILQRPVFGRTFEVLVCGTLCNWTYFTSLPLVINIGFNRYFSICRKSLYVTVYKTQKIFITIIACCCIGLISAIPQLTPCCYLRYFESDYSFGYDMDLDGNAYYVWYDRSHNMVTFFCIVICYSCIFLKLRQVRRSTNPMFENRNSNAEKNKQRSDVNLAIQSALVAGLMITFGLGFTIIPLVTANKWCILMSSVLYILSIGVHPFVYLAFNEKIRKAVRQLAGFSNYGAVTTADQTAGQSVPGTKQAAIVNAGDQSHI